MSYESCNKHQVSLAQWLGARQWVVFDPEEPPEFFATAEQAKKHAEGILQEYRDRADEGWDEEVTDTEWGQYIVHEVVQETSRTPADEDCEFDDYLEYGLVPVTPHRSEGDDVVVQVRMRRSNFMQMSSGGIELGRDAITLEPIKLALRSVGGDDGIYDLECVAPSICAASVPEPVDPQLVEDE